MSACNIVVTPDAAHLFADGASYDETGRVKGISSKIYTMPKLSAAMITTGRVVDSVYTLDRLQGLALDFDDLVDNISDWLPEIDELCGDLFGSDEHGLGQRMCVAGWSPRRGACYGFGIATFNDTNGLPAFTPIEIVGGMQSPALSPDELLKGFGHLPTMEDVRDIERMAVTVLELQRQQRATWSDGRHIVGGLVELVSIRRDRIESKILKRWPDQVGELITPEPIDWPTFRAEQELKRANVDLTGLSRLQRERMEKKARKGTLRR